ncbi:MAG: NTP transferase domain-containing protein [Actinomycetia bacterium]|nr:NTP transferase domain-containing protein [Actinomycetes bacterium]
MGSDKGLLEIDGVPMVRHVAEAMAAAGVAEVVIAGARSDEMGAAARCQVLDDPLDDRGPLAGVASALEFCDHIPGADVVVVCPCDVPGVHADDFRLLLAVLVSRSDVDVAYMRHGDRIEPLVSAWRPHTARKVVEDAIVAGSASVRSVLEHLDVAEIEAPEPRRLVNINTPADLAELIRHRQRRADR